MARLKSSSTMSNSNNQEKFLAIQSAIESAIESLLHQEQA